MKPILVALMLALTFTAGPASAAPTDKQRASALLQQGFASYTRGDYAAALELYRRANALFPSPQLQFNMALAYHRMGQRALAAEHFERFLGTVDATAYPDKVAKVAARLRALRSQLATVTVACGVQGATVTASGRLVGKTPLRHRVYLTPGTFTLTVEHAEFQRATRELKVSAGEHRRLQLVLQPLKPTPAPTPAPATQPLVQVSPIAAPTPRPIYQRWWFWTAVGVVVAGVTAGSVAAATTGGSDWQPQGELPPIKLQ